MWDMNDVIPTEHKNKYVFHITFDNRISGDIVF